MENTTLPMSILQTFQSLSISSTTIDFGREFASNKTPEEFVGTVNQYLQLHNRDKIKKFRVFFSPRNEFLQDILNWVAFAVAKGVEELDLDLSMGADPWSNEFPNGENPFNLPASLFECKTLTNLILSHCDFCPPPGFTGFHRLHSLSLTSVSIAEDELHHLLANYPILDSLRLRTCPSLESIRLHSHTLERLTIVNPCSSTYEIEISCPKLRSFIYYGAHIFGDWYGVFSSRNSFIDISSLSDAFISSTGLEHTEPEHDYIKVLSDLKQVKVLTVCTATLLYVALYDPFGNEPLLPILLQNLKELQLLMCTMFSDDLFYIYSFFRLCPSPFLEKLFIRLPNRPADPDRVSLTEKVEEPPEIAFNHLKAIKLINFKGCKHETRLVRFLLERAVVLEILVLVAPPKADLKGNMDIEQSEQERAASLVTMNMISFCEQLPTFGKASPGANIVLCEYLGDDSSLTPTHTEYFCEFWED